MGWFDGFPFQSKEERDRRKRDFEKRVTPFGVEAHREKLKAVLAELFPSIDQTDLLFAYFDAKDAYSFKETKDEGIVAAQAKLRKHRWLDGRKETILLHLIDMDMRIQSLDAFPTARDVMSGLFE